MLCDGKPSELKPALKLTIYQAMRIIRAKRDKEGALVVSPKKLIGELNNEEVFTRTWLRRGLKRWMIEKKWKEYLATVKKEQLREVLHGHAAGR